MNACTVLLFLSPFFSRLNNKRGAQCERQQWHSLVVLLSCLLPITGYAFSLNSTQKTTDAINSQMNTLSLDEFNNMQRLPNKLKEFKDLEYLSANGNHITDLKVIQSLKQLRVLSINYTKVIDI